MLEIIQEFYGPRMRQIGLPVYRKTYLDWVDRVYELPRGYKVLELTLFLGDDNQSIIGSDGRFKVQCGEVETNDLLKLRLFSNSLTGTTSSLYFNLPPNLVNVWQEMKHNSLSVLPDRTRGFNY